MLAFVVLVNGQRVCSVGLSSLNTRGIQLSWIGNTKTNERLFLHVGGMDDDEHVSWSVPQIKIGDEVTIKIIEDSAPDLPTARKSVEEMDQWSRDLGRSKEQNERAS